jgi:hypothetical protein
MKLKLTLTPEEVLIVAPWDAKYSGQKILDDADQQKLREEIARVIGQSGEISIEFDTVEKTGRVVE